MTYRERLEMKAIDFSSPKHLGEASRIHPQRAAEWANAHLDNLPEVLERVEANAPGCTDSGCPFTLHLGGMRTNAGCRCLRDKARIIAFQEAIAALRAWRDGK